MERAGEWGGRSKNGVLLSREDKAKIAMLATTESGSDSARIRLQLVHHGLESLIGWFAMYDREVSVFENSVPIIGDCGGAAHCERENH